MFVGSFAIEDTSVESVVLLSNSEFKIQFLSGGVVILRDNLICGDQWVNAIKSSMYDLGLTGNLERKSSLTKKKKKKV